jgi:hypothetical protein
LRESSGKTDAPSRFNIGDYMFAEGLRSYSIAFLVALFLVAPSLSYADCSAVRLEQGGAGGVRVRNQSQNPIYVYKVDKEGSRSLLRVVIPGADFDTSYLITAIAWLVATTDDRCIGAYQLNQQSFDVVVTQALADRAGTIPRIAAQPAASSSSYPEPSASATTGGKRAERCEDTCYYLAKLCYQRAERDYKWYMSFFHRDQIDRRDYDAEESRAVRERKESVEECSATRDECLGKCSNDED